MRSGLRTRAKWPRRHRPSKRKAWCQASKHPCPMIADATAALMAVECRKRRGCRCSGWKRAEQSTLWITASEDGASATCVGVAPACKELRSGPNKSEREPTSARSTNYGSGHLIPAFHGTGRTFSLLPSHPLDAASGSIDAPLVSCLRGKVPRPKMVSSNQKRFQLCFVRNSPWGTSEPRVFHQKREPRPSPPRWGGGFSGTLIWWCTKGFCYEGSVSQIHGRG